MGQDLDLSYKGHTFSFTCTLSLLSPCRLCTASDKQNMEIFSKHHFMHDKVVKQQLKINMKQHSLHFWHFVMQLFLSEQQKKCKYI